MREKSAKLHGINIPMALACVLFCLVLISTHFTSGLYARYIVTDSASDSARVVAFREIRITEEINGQPADSTQNTVKITPLVGIEKQAYVDFDGAETDTYIFVQVDAAKWTKNGSNYKIGTLFEWNVDAYWTQVPDVAEDVYYVRLDANNTLVKKAIIKDGTISVSSKIPADISAQLENMTMSFRAIVVQANGFESPTQAWQSVRH